MLYGKDKRYKETEDKILRLFFESGGEMSVTEMARQIGVARSTIYRHHRSTRRILDDYKDAAMMEYLERFGSSEDKIDRIFLNILVFVSTNREIFLVFLKMHDDSVLAAMIWLARRRLVEVVEELKREKVFKIYVGEVVATVKYWGERGFLEDKIVGVLSDIMFLSSTVAVRLGEMM